MILVLAQGEVTLVTSGTEDGTVSVQFYVTKFDLFSFKSQHSFYNFLISHRYDLTIRSNSFVVVQVQQDFLLLVTYFTFTLLTFPSSYHS